jgi:hypothetical protein
MKRDEMRQIAFTLARREIRVGSRVENKIVEKILSHRIPQNAGISCLAEQIFSLKNNSCSTKFVRSLTDKLSWLHSFPSTNGTLTTP